MAKVKHEVIIGDIFGRLTITCARSSHKNKSWYHKAKCICGKEKEFAHSNIVSGKSKSCGCLSREITSKVASTHGMSKTAEYAVWSRVWSRCTNPVVERYPNYGGRGISVCERWAKFENFFSDMGFLPSKNHSIGRIDNDGNYNPENCRWETREQQANNTSKSRWVDFNGKRMSVTSCAKLLGISADTLGQRLIAGISGDDLFSLSDLRPKPITVNGETRGTVEWMKFAIIPISSFYLLQRKGMTPEDIIKKYLLKKTLLAA